MQTTDSLEEETSLLRRQKASKSKTWSFPNQKEQPSMMVRCPPMEIPLNLDQTIHKTNGFLIVVFCLVLLLYLYVPMLERRSSRSPANQRKRRQLARAGYRMGTVSTSLGETTVTCNILRERPVSASTLVSLPAPPATRSTTLPARPKSSRLPTTLKLRWRVSRKFWRTFF